VKAALAFVVTIMLFGATIGISRAEDPQPAEQAAAQAVAQTWLGLIDAGEGPASWASASSLFRARVTEAQWTSAVTGVRDGLGPLKSRTLQSTTLQHTLPGAPDGRYIVFKYSSVFANKASATETVTPMLEADGTWHVSGYYVR
jgi:hypothetical protein